MNRRLATAVRLAFIAGLLTLPGCRKSPPAADGLPPTRKSAPIRDAWDIYFLQGNRIGYGHTNVVHGRQDGRQVVVTNSLNHLAVKREGQTTQEDIRVQSVETPEGRLIRFDTELRLGPSPIRSMGEVHGDQLVITTSSTGAAPPAGSSTSIPWLPNCGGPFAMEQSLLRKPMRPGERRELKSLMVGFNQIADVELDAKDFEPTKLLGGTYHLLRIDTVTRLPDGQKLDGIVWTDRMGDALKTYSQAMGLETYRAAKAEALEEAGAAELDLMPATMVKLKRPLPNAHHTQEVQYRISLDGGDPSGAFVAGPTQAIKPLDAQTALVTVYAIRPGQSDGNRHAPADPPTDDDLQPNSFIQSDDPKIRSDAAKAAGGETDPWRVAVALERYVHREVKNKNYSQAFATSAEVARSREGDCTEHAVFLAALARARDIPARVAVGLIYMPSAQAFGYHMWTEAHIDKRWIPIDGTLALGGIGAAHLKIAHSNLKGASIYSAFLPVVQIIGRLGIEVADAK
jgi:hypothetical protein